MRIFFAFFLILLLGIFSCTYQTRPFLDPEGKPVSNSIAEIRPVKLGGWEQWITIRGKNREMPLLLFVNGGPGSPTFGLFEKYLPRLEEEFVVVSWDQRSAGKSFKAEMDPGTLTVARSISDLHELSVLLLKEFQRDKLFLVGLSWGSLLSLYEIDQHPELYYAYVSAGQITNRPKEEELSMKYVKEKAKEFQNNKALAELEKIRFEVPGVLLSIEDLKIQRKWLETFEGTTGDPDFMKDFIDTFINASEYTIFDKMKLQKGMDYSIRHLFPAFSTIRIDREIREVQIPVYFCVGKKDWTIPVEVTRKYFEELKAPEKKIIEFDYSGHFMLFEQPDEFQTIMIDLVKTRHYQTKS